MTIANAFRDSTTTPRENVIVYEKFNKSFQPQNNWDSQRKSKEVW